MSCSNYEHQVKTWEYVSFSGEDTSYCYDTPGVPTGSNYISTINFFDSLLHTIDYDSLGYLAKIGNYELKVGDEAKVQKNNLSLKIRRVNLYEHPSPENFIFLFSDKFGIIYYHIPHKGTLFLKQIEKANSETNLSILKNEILDNSVLFPVPEISDTIPEIFEVTD